MFFTINYRLQLLFSNQEHSIIFMNLFLYASIYRQSVECGVIFYASIYRRYFFLYFFQHSFSWRFVNFRTERWGSGQDLHHSAQWWSRWGFWWRFRWRRRRGLCWQSWKETSPSWFNCYRFKRKNNWRQGLWQGGKSEYRPNLQKIVKDIRGFFVLFLEGARVCLRQETEVQ